MLIILFYFQNETFFLYKIAINYLLSPLFMLFLYLFKIFFFYFTFCVFLYIIYILNITKAIKKISVNEIKDFIFQNYYKGIGFSKENNYYLMKHFKTIDILLFANKLIEKIPDPRNAKEHQQSFIRKKNTKF